MPARRAMKLTDALQVLVNLRNDQVIVTTMGSAREWIHMSHHPLDLNYVPSTMGGGIPLGLGIALAQPQRHVVVISGDGSFLMNLGALVTVSASAAPNLTIIVINNGVYEITGGQKLATSKADVNFPGIALAAGLPAAETYEDLDSWRTNASRVWAQPGPGLIDLKVVPVTTDYSLVAPPSMPDRIAKFRAALCGNSQSQP